MCETSRILSIPKFLETELAGNADQARIPLILRVPIGIAQISRINSENSTKSKNSKRNS